MKLAAIYNVWDGVELLNGSMQSVADGVDLFIIVFQRVSNFGEHFDPWPYIQGIHGVETIYHEYQPDEFNSFAPGHHEKNKRNIGLNIARIYGCTHFLHLDCDEYYLDFLQMKQTFLDSRARGSACKIYTYFKSPTLRLMHHDNYFVPFIHELRPNTFAGGHMYPHYVDPTRKINVDGAVPIVGDMHHYSWIRKNIERKVRNSTARANIERSNLLKDYNDPDVGAGSHLVDYQNQQLIKVNDYFGIGEMIKN